MLLESFAALDYPREEFEVVVVDDGSVPPLEPTVRIPEGLTVRLLRCDHGGPAPARQAGVALARGRYLAFTDDDCRPARDWLRVLEATLEQHPDCAVGGRTENGLAGNPFAEASECLVGYLYAYHEAHPREPRFFLTNNVGMAAAAFRAMGGLDPTWRISGGEDRDLFSRWQKYGFGMVYEPRMVVSHAHPLNWRRFADQHYRYGRGSFRFRARHTRTPSGRLSVAPLSFYLRLPMAAFRHGVSGRAMQIAALLFASQLFHALGFIAEAAQHVLGRQTSTRQVEAERAALAGPSRVPYES